MRSLARVKAFFFSRFFSFLFLIQCGMIACDMRDENEVVELARETESELCGLFTLIFCVFFSPWESLQLLPNTLDMTVSPDFDEVKTGIE
jgi:hypothetical protein